jgi:hypothetical protein
VYLFCVLQWFMICPFSRLYSCLESAKYFIFQFRVLSCKAIILPLVCVPSLDNDLIQPCCRQIGVLTTTQHNKTSHSSTLIQSICHSLYT